MTKPESGRKKAALLTEGEARALLNELLRLDDDKLTDDTRAAFEDMQESDRVLSAKQVSWINGVADKNDIANMSTANLWSSLSVAEQARIRGKDVPTPASLQNRPLKPPGRK